MHINKCTRKISTAIHSSAQRLLSVLFTTLLRGPSVKTYEEFGILTNHKLAGWPATVGWRLAENMRLLGQRQRTLLLYGTAGNMGFIFILVSLAFCPSNPIEGMWKWAQLDAELTVFDHIWKTQSLITPNLITKLQVIVSNLWSRGSILFKIVDIKWIYLLPWKNTLSFSFKAACLKKDSGKKKKKKAKLSVFLPRKLEKAWEN